MFSQMFEEQNIHKHTHTKDGDYLDPSSHVKTKSEGVVLVTLVLHPSGFPQKESVN